MMNLNTQYTIAKNWILRSDPSYTPPDTLFDINSGRLLVLSKGLFALLKVFYFDRVPPSILINELKDRGINFDITKILNIEEIVGANVFTTNIQDKCLEDRKYNLQNLSKNNTLIEKYLAPVSNSPIDVEMHLTHKCNLRCQHCFQESSPTSDKGEIILSPTEWIDVFKKLEQASVNRIIISGGEPLFYPEFRLLARSIFDLNISYYILSNGTLITKSMAGLMSKENVTVNISLDGRSKELHEILRGRNTYHRTIRGIENLIESGAKTIISSVIHKQNRYDLGNFISFLIDLGVKEATFGFIEPLGRAALNKQLLLSQKEEFDDLNLFTELREKFQPHIKLSFPSLPLTLEEHLTNSQIVYCAAGTRRLSIASNGDAYPCIMAFEKPNFFLGNLLRDELNDVWRSEKLNVFRGDLKLETINGCNTCKMSSYCTYKNCRLKYYSNEYGLLGKPNNCMKDKVESLDQGIDILALVRKL
ncbi:radical SAM/SPASM domain-containing protein [Porphyromonas somerae]|uniref:radical SAM/SPASM domain-containing protein n=1 Tax=Porphyromonas somerae TaxID=322095 RepID=UPI002A83E9F3|nr:radical SAM protein [Porphyromonas somerae]MDY3885590.1 radical SAM protein [Porphyromonas somerae]